MSDRDGPGIMDSRAIGRSVAGAPHATLMDFVSPGSPNPEFAIMIPASPRSRGGFGLRAHLAAAAFSLVAFAGTFLAPAAQADVWTADVLLTTGGGDVAMTVTIDDVTEEVDIALTGSDSAWFAVGFGGSTMSGTYTIVTYPGGTVEERQLGEHNPGLPIGPTITLDAWSTPGGGVATFEMSRVADPGVANVYVFPLADVQSGTPIPMIWGIGQGTSFTYHGPINKATGGQAFAPGGAVSADEPAVEDLSWGRVKMLFHRAG